MFALLQGCGGRHADVAPPFVAGLAYCYGCYQPLVQPGQAGSGTGSRAGGAPAPGTAQAAAAAAAAAAGGGGIVSRCPDCRNLYCFECDAHIHEQLHNCPGCECLPPVLAAADGGGG